MDDRKRQQLEAQLSAYLDNELSEPERTEVEAFLTEYAEARELLAELRATVELVKQLPRAKVSDQMMDDLRARLERDALLGESDFEKPSPQGSISKGWRWMGVAAVIGLACITAYMMGPFSNHPASHEMKFAFRDEKPPQTMEKSARDLDLGKRKAEAPVSAIVAKDESAAQPAQMEAAKEIPPAAPGLAAVPPMPAPPAESHNNQSIKLLELSFADEVARDQALQRLRTGATNEKWSFHEADEPKQDAAAAASIGIINVDVALPQGSDVNQAADKLTHDTSSRPAGEPPLGEIASAARLQANKPVLLAPQSQHATDAAAPAYLIRLRLSTISTAATQPAATTAPSTQP